MGDEGQGQGQGDEGGDCVGVGFCLDVGVDVGVGLEGQALLFTSLFVRMRPEASDPNPKGGNTAKRMQSRRSTTDLIARSGRMDDTRLELQATRE